jgi:hypothetical protein
MPDDESFAQSEDTPRDPLDDARESAQETVAKLDDLHDALERGTARPSPPSPGPRPVFEDAGNPFGTAKPFQSIDISTRDTGNEQGGPIDPTDP